MPTVLTLTPASSSVLALVPAGPITYPSSFTFPSASTFPGTVLLTVAASATVLTLTAA